MLTRKPPLCQGVGLRSNASPMRITGLTAQDTTSGYSCQKPGKPQPHRLDGLTLGPAGLLGEPCTAAHAHLTSFWPDFRYRLTSGTMNSPRPGRPSISALAASAFSPVNLRAFSSSVSIGLRAKVSSSRNVLRGEKYLHFVNHVAQFPGIFRHGQSLFAGPASPRR